VIAALMRSNSLTAWSEIVNEELSGDITCLDEKTFNENFNDFFNNRV